MPQDADFNEAAKIAVIENNVTHLQNELKGIEASADDRFKKIEEKYFSKTDILKLSAPVLGIAIAFASWFGIDAHNIRDQIKINVEAYYKDRVSKNIETQVANYYKDKVSKDITNTVAEKTEKARKDAMASVDSGLLALKIELNSKINEEVNKENISMLDAMRNQNKSVNLEIEKSLAARLQIATSAIDMQISKNKSRIDEQLASEQSQIAAEVQQIRSDATELKSKVSEEINKESDLMLSNVQDQNKTINDKIEQGLAVRLQEANRIINSQIAINEAKIDQQMDSEKSQVVADIQRMRSDAADSLHAALSSELDARDRLIREEINKSFEDLRNKIDVETIKNALLTQIQASISDKIQQVIPIMVTDKSAAAVDHQFKNLLGDRYAGLVARLKDAAQHFEVDSGYFLCGPALRPSNPLAHSLNDENAIVFSKEIHFNRKFQRQPKIVISLNSINATANEDKEYALWADARKTTDSGFEFILKSMMKDVHNCKVHWMAIDEFSAQDVE